VRSLNSKNLDVTLKLPQIYKEKEQYLRNKVATALQRGKIELSLQLENLTVQTEANLNKPLIEQYLHELEQIASKAGLNPSDQLLAAVLRMPDVVKQEAPGPLSENEWEIVSRTITQALQQNNEFRISEGRQLEQHLKETCLQISSLLEQIPAFEKNRLESLRNRILKSLSELKESVQVDQNRFEQELLYYIEKFDISEEKVRLAKHIEFFFETMHEESNGKKLGFISQEMGREINTLGSKANDATIQRLVVQMKDELEKIKEQLMNVL
jgi:uncharacterized protein (TIGR00255 family)